MRGAGRMDDQRFGIANIGQVREQFDVANELFASLQSALDTKTENSSIAMSVIFGRDLVLRMTGQAGIADPIDSRMTFQELGDAQGILAVTLHTQRQGLQPLQEQPRVEGGGCST